MERKLHVVIPIVSLLTPSYSKQYNETKSLDVIDFNEQLEAVNKFSPEINSGDFISWKCNNQGDLFIGWFNGTSLDFVKYKAGKNSPAGKISSEATFKKESKDLSPRGYIYIEPAKKAGDVLYYSLMYKNPASKEMELGIGKLDFSDGKKQFVTEVFSKNHIKSLEKAFVPVNKKMDKPDLKEAKNLGIKEIREDNGRLVIALTATRFVDGWGEEGSTLLNGYDGELNLKFQQFIPAGYTFPHRLLSSSYHFSNNKLSVVSNDKRGQVTVFATYAVLDLTSGQWDKMIWLSKKKISNSEFVGGESVLWYGNNFIVPYLDTRTGITNVKYDITLQQNSL
jgi:hypothetical protein